MARVTVSLPKGVHEKLMKYAGDNDVSLSHSVTKMAELGLMVSERRAENKRPEDSFTEIEKHCFKLTIQMNALMKKLVEKDLGYGQDEFKKLSDLTVDKYNKLTCIFSDEL